MRIALEADAQKRSDLVQPEGALDLGASRTAMQQVDLQILGKPHVRIRIGRLNFEGVELTFQRLQLD